MASGSFVQTFATRPPSMNPAIWPAAGQPRSPRRVGTVLAAGCKARSIRASVGGALHVIGVVRPTARSCRAWTQGQSASADREFSLTNRPRGCSVPSRNEFHEHPKYRQLDLPGFVEGCGLGIRVSGLRAFCSPVWCHSFVRPPAEPFFHPGPHEDAAVARSGGQGRPHLGAARRACP
jgi:hypothetical protein